nr:uncharacterized protein LOC109975782 [Labrus bergylta]
MQLEALSMLTIGQLAEVAARPGQLTSAAQVEMLAGLIPDRHLPDFFDDFSTAIVGHEDMLQHDVRTAMLQVVFNRANLSNPSVSDSVVFVWLHVRMRPLVHNMSHLQVAPFFQILSGRGCNIQQLGVDILNGTISSLSDVTHEEVQTHIILSLRGPVALQCYGNNFNRSFYEFMVRSFLGFQLPKLNVFLSLISHDRTNQLVNSMPPSHLGALLQTPDFINNETALCDIFNVYDQTAVFLQTVILTKEVQWPTLFCVWPLALRITEKSEVDAFFSGLSNNNYTDLLDSSLISPEITHNASCLAFQRIVAILGEFNFNAADFQRSDVFLTIRSYLTSGTVPRCYDPSNPDLNSTAWFAEYIGPFISFLTLEDLLSFGSQR